MKKISFENIILLIVTAIWDVIFNLVSLALGNYDISIFSMLFIYAVITIMNYFAISEKNINLYFSIFNVIMLIFFFAHLICSYVTITTGITTLGIGGFFLLLVFITFIVYFIIDIVLLSKNMIHYFSIK